MLDRHRAQPGCQLQQTGFFLIPEHPDQACLISCFVDKGLEKQQILKQQHSRQETKIASKLHSRPLLMSQIDVMYTFTHVLHTGNILR